jgi:hypothetical protein
MRKYIIIGSVSIFILAAFSVFALQGRNPQTAAANEVAPLTASASVSGCGLNGSGCASSAGCGDTSGGCGTAGLNPAEAKARTEQIVTYLTDYYTAEMGYKSVQVTIEDFGCHQEATVTQDGQLVDRLSISGNRITKIES